MILTTLKEGRKGKDKETDEDELEGEEEDSGSVSKPLRTTFELNDTLYAEAELEDSDTVYLWLGVRACVALTFLRC